MPFNEFSLCWIRGSCSFFFNFDVYRYTIKWISSWNALWVTFSELITADCICKLYFPTHKNLWCFKISRSSVVNYWVGIIGPFLLVLSHTNKKLHSIAEYLRTLDRWFCSKFFISHVFECTSQSLPIYEFWSFVSQNETHFDFIIFIVYNVMCLRMIGYGFSIWMRNRL